MSRPLSGFRGGKNPAAASQRSHWDQFPAPDMRSEDPRRAAALAKALRFQPSARPGPHRPQTARNPRAVRRANHAPAPSTRQTAPTQKAVHSPALPCKPPKRNFAAPEARAPSHSSPGARHLQGHVHYRNLRVPRVSTAAENPSRTYGPPILLFSITSPSGFRRSPGDTAFPFQRQARSAAFRLRGRL